VLAALPARGRWAGGAGAAGRPAVHDVDVAAPPAAGAIAGAAARAGLKVFETGLAHGTVTAVLTGAGGGDEPPPRRRDRRPPRRGAWTTDWREDAARRDFTITHVALGRGGALGLFRRTGGPRGRARALRRRPGDAAAGGLLAALRFFRFQARYGADGPGCGGRRGDPRGGAGLARLSAERVWMELSG
jgi:poly(A) polymerase/tRNA nucleotidyltransferase (CCA-adding enzyme)